MTVGSLAIGLILLGIGITMVITSALGLGRSAGSTAAPASAEMLADLPLAPLSGTGRIDGYPARLSGEFDAHPSRGLWLVKWLLAIPHYVALSFLWVALIASTLVAAVAILTTGHYPRPLFHFNVGVLRWTWRVGFYSYGALGTDRYPPFTLTRTDYPANFDVTYPEHLSRGLVLIKSWLLALPHLVIVALLTTAARYWWTTRANLVDASPSFAQISLLGALVTP